MPNLIILLLTLSISIITSPSITEAYNAPSSELVTLHNRILDNPDDLDLLYKYTQVAIREGDFEAAISALESVLIISRNQPRLFLELGVLYQRLDAPKTARIYLQTAKKLSGSGSKIAILADEYLGETKKKDTQHNLAGVIGFGLRYQQNPTLSPETPEILSGGFNVPLPEERERKADSNALLFSRINHRYHLTPRTSLASEFILYATAHNKNDQLNIGLLELQSGPLLESIRNASGHYNIRPHIVLRGSYLDGNLFEKTSGLGLDFTMFPGINTWMTPQIKAQYQFLDTTYEDYNNLGSAPLNSGDEHRIDLRYWVELSRGHLIEIGLLGRQTNTERKYLDSEQYKINFRYSLKFDNSLFQKQSRVTVTPSVTRGIHDFDAPDPNIDPTTTRSDREWQIGLRCHLPYTKTQTLLFDMEHRTKQSNIINYDLKDNMVMVIFQKEL